MIRSNFSQLAFNIIMSMTLSLGLVACDGINQKKEETTAVQNPSTNVVNQEINKSSKSDDLPTYNVATISTFVPFILRDEQGNTTGFDVDILKAIGEKEGFNVNYLVVPWEKIFETLDKGSHDIISSAIVITPERQKLVDFSDPYINSGRMAVVRKKLKDKEFQDLKDITFVTQNGTSNVPILEAFVSNKNNISVVDTQFLEIEKVLSGKVDAAFDDSRVMQYYVSKNPDLYGIPDFDYKGDKFGFAVKKGNQKLIKQINSGLKKIISDGTYEKIYKKWFQELPPKDYRRK